MWVTTEGGDYDNALLKPYEEALHKAKVTVSSPLLHGVLGCAALLCAVLMTCCAVTSTHEAWGAVGLCYAVLCCASSWRPMTYDGVDQHACMLTH